VKERQAEDHLFGDKEKFVTAAYKKKLQQQQLWQAQQKIKCAENRRICTALLHVCRNHLCPCLLAMCCCNRCASVSVHDDACTAAHSLLLSVHAVHRRDERDAANAAEKVGDMSGFYGNLMTRNVAFGASGCAPAGLFYLSFSPAWLPAVCRRVPYKTTAS